MINFGDCLVRPEGAKAIAASVSEGLPILKVSEGNPTSSMLQVVVGSRLGQYLIFPPIILTTGHRVNDGIRVLTIHRVTCY